MVTPTVRFTVELAIDEAKRDAFEHTAQAMIAGSEREPGTLGYMWCLSADRKRCRLVETFADAQAVVIHLKSPIVQELVPRLLESAQLTRFEVYGDPGPEGSALLAGMGADIFPPWRGFSE